MNMSTKTIKISIDDLIDKFKKYNDNEKLKVINNYQKEFKLKLKKHV